MNFLSGYKTYIIAGLMALIGAVHLFTGDSTITTFVNDPNFALLLQGLGLGFLRAGITKVA